MEGWIKLHRKFKNWEWYGKSEMVHLFIHLLLSANREEKKWRGNIVKRGQLITGLHSLNSDTGISIQTLRTCLRRLEETNEINKQTNKQFTLITICNYDDYQQKDNTTNKQTNKRSTNDQQTTNNKQEYKEYKNILLSDLKKSDFEDSTYYEITISFYELFKHNLQEKNISTTILEKAKGKWIDSIRLLIENDKHTIQDLRDVFQFLKTDEFWKSNILSTSKLREKFKTLLIKSRSNGGEKQNRKGATGEEILTNIHKHFGVNENK